MQYQVNAAKIYQAMLKAEDISSPESLALQTGLPANRIASFVRVLIEEGLVEEVSPRQWRLPKRKRDQAATAYDVLTEAMWGAVAAGEDNIAMKVLLAVEAALQTADVQRMVTNALMTDHSIEAIDSFARLKEDRRALQMLVVGVIKRRLA